jgi:hypothetical protein
VARPGGARWGACEGGADAGKPGSALGPLPGAGAPPGLRVWWVGVQIERVGVAAEATAKGGSRPRGGARRKWECGSCCRRVPLRESVPACVFDREAITACQRWT